MLIDKKVLLCVTGGIAVFKAAALTSKLTQEGAHVKVIMSESARKFVTPLTFQALSRNDVYTDTFDEKDSSVIAHIDLADWADIILVAPATANVIGKIANGIADDMITTTLLATVAPVWVAPAMNVHMYAHPAVQKNMETLRTFGYQFIEPGEGYLACGYVGKGRLEEPETIVAHLIHYFGERKSQPQLLKGKKYLITAGPTREAIDPVRYVTNHSSGKMGYALAEQAIELGAEVTLITGPVNLTPPSKARVIPVESAADMYEAVFGQFDSSDVVIMTAAVADYKPKNYHAQKMKKQPGENVIEFERTKDILKELGENKTHQILVGFAAETNNVEEYARGKLVKKNADMIVANNVTVAGAGFGTDTNIVTIYDKNGSATELPKMSKADIAKSILAEVSRMQKE
ncbi:bifunctional phosphopantothenoylcysteine decarboxylase/phosphopantothenate--cysteine ligase CoaBC [Peribacillus simplex]|uniref:bifunctional phosphopantothenoylcysteine decarboxylase/phosphopantothenate--cysteine ligase CoaBC n=2 Tax=Bacillales TaxID=1385 RepID=UPI0007776C76|nr:MULTISPECIES: bifunctional phosphopantothenoylcysteine decarboxylase/phosphopantothenate--cysteine ligase CoaBC [Peribacillus]AMM92407.1 phosphopantothenoylcysteine decarboxylase [Peribacillus simplex]MDM5295510.1 bifunctional phosphopantothenoylcysteine decarboxylase/phosphopantothenate--cysteine ligase CoaBC [Peribacillus simplex]MDV7763207.1 bifunctional phosphopantothenoylcysteine decarboxylase/phosphopantothenate--cysteine ligase CoaBC [Peribacillus sp. CSMR9]MDW7613267.1 bifunctional p